ncbi:MAG: hypothetical protein IPH59_08230 [bacterium]|nr:hypothetical protein [bacterium]
METPVSPAPGFRFVFNPDLNVVSDLIVRTWEHPCWKYDPGLLELHIMRPTGDPTLTVGQIDEKGNLASYVAFMPFDVEYFGKSYRAVFCSFMTVATEYHGKGLNGPQQVALLQKSMERDYDLYIVICEDGAVSNISLERIFAKRDRKLQLVKNLGYIGARRDLLQPVLSTQPSAHTRQMVRNDLASVSVLAAEIGRGCDLRRIISPLDVEFLFIDRPHTSSFVYESAGKTRAFANLLLLEVLDKEASLNLYFENVHFGDLNESEQIEFMGDCLTHLLGTGFRMAILPDIGYTNIEPFRKLRFRALPRRLNLYMSELKPGIVPNGIRDVNRIYMDIY